MGYFNGSKNGSRVVYCRYIYVAGLWLMKDSKHDSIDEYDKSCVIVKRAWGNYVNIWIFCDYNRELKQIRFWAADVNRNLVYVLAFSTFPCPNNELQSSHFSIYNLTFWMKRVKYASTRRSLDFRLTSVAQKRLCLSSLLCCCQLNENWSNPFFLLVRQTRKYWTKRFRNIL